MFRQVECLLGRLLRLGVESQGMPCRGESYVGGRMLAVGVDRFSRAGRARRGNQSGGAFADLPTTGGTPRDSKEKEKL